MLVAVGERHWEIYQRLLEISGLTGSDTTDAYLAALAMEQGCEWWTTDQDFECFPNLRVCNLLRP